MTTRAPRIGSVSHGTLRAEDLIPTFLDTLGTLGGESAVSAACRDAVFPSHMESECRVGADGYYHGYTWSDAESPETRAYLESDDAADDIRQLVDALNALAPDYTYFGTHEGDASDYGYWPSWESIDADSITVADYLRGRRADPLGVPFGLLRVSDLSEVPSDYSGTVLLVNDHGNATCYAATSGSVSEIWSAV